MIIFFSESYWNQSDKQGVERIARSQAEEEVAIARTQVFLAFKVLSGFVDLIGLRSDVAKYARNRKRTQR